MPSLNNYNTSIRTICQIVVGMLSPNFAAGKRVDAPFIFILVYLIGFDTLSALSNLVGRWPRFRTSKCPANSFETCLSCWRLWNRHLDLASSIGDLERFGRFFVYAVCFQWEAVWSPLSIQNAVFT